MFGRSLRVSGENGYMRDALFVLISISYGMVFLEGTRGLLCRSKSLSLPGYPCDLLNLLGALDSSQDYLYDLNIRRSWLEVKVIVPLSGWGRHATDLPIGQLLEFFIYSKSIDFTHLPFFINFKESFGGSNGTGDFPDIQKRGLNWPTFYKTVEKIFIWAESTTCHIVNINSKKWESPW